MGANGALNCGEVVSLLQQVLAALLIALSNAAALRDESRFAPAGQRLLRAIRRHSPPLTADRRLDHDLRRLAEAIDRDELFETTTAATAV